MRGVSERVEGFDRYVNTGVLLRVVRVDPAGDIALESGRRVRQVGEHRWGGWLDTKATVPAIVGACAEVERTVWLCSERQEHLIMHDDARALGQLVIGSEGSGKTTALAMWHHRRWTIDGVGEFREGGQTAPTLARLGLVRREIEKLWRPSWRRWVERRDFEGFELCDGCRIRFRHTQRQSAAAGSPIQGFNWSWAGRDEFQDQIEVHNDIESRGRAAKGGKYKQLATATAKDDQTWRRLRDDLVSGGQWDLTRLLVADSPFVAENFLAVKRASGITDREFRRRYLAEDLPPESRLYHTFDRKQNLRPIPLGAKRITSVVLKAKTGDARDSMLIGHDPGAAKSGTVWLDAYSLPPAIAAQLGCVAGEVFWWARWELLTHGETVEEHAVKALAITRDRFGHNWRADSERAHVRCQPLGMSESKPDQSVLAIWKRIGFDIRAAQYSKHGAATGNIPKEARIGMMCSLFCDAMGRRRLFLECDDRGNPMTPKLLEAIESMERDDRGRAEADKKDIRYDKSDLPTAAGYGLWFVEKELASALRADIKRAL